jgi:hypothetical protein
MPRRQRPSADPPIALPPAVMAGVVDFCFRSMPDFFRGERAPRVRAVVEWTVTGDVGGRWQLHLDAGRCTVVRDGLDRPDLRLMIDPVPFVGLCLGIFGATRLVISGQLRPRGNLLLLARLPSFFDFPSAPPRVPDEERALP